MFRTFQYRLLPSKAQHRALEAVLESQRELYNAALEERIGAYRRGVRRTLIDQNKALAELRQSDSEFASLPSNLQRGTLKRLDEAYKAYFRRAKQTNGRAGFPRFRGKGRWDSFEFREFSGITFNGRCLHFRGMPGALKVHMHRAIPEEASIRSCVFKRDVRGWTIGFAVESMAPCSRAGTRSVGIDLGVTIFAALSDGGFIPSLKAARRAERRLRVAQRALTRRTRGSNGRRKARITVARCHAAIARARANHLHQASARLVREYDVIAVESLNVRGLSRGPLARDVHDAAWSKFLLMVRYKAEGAGAQLIQVDPYNTSQDCSGCGATVQKTWEQRLHDCPHCGLRIDRDLNAAKNILHRAGVGPGLRNVADYSMRAGRNLSANDTPKQHQLSEAPRHYPTAIPNLASNVTVS